MRVGGALLSLITPGSSARHGPPGRQRWAVVVRLTPSSWSSRLRTTAAVQRPAISSTCSALVQRGMLPMLRLPAPPTTPRPPSLWTTRRALPRHPPSLRTNGTFARKVRTKVPFVRAVEGEGREGKGREGKGREGWEGQGLELGFDVTEDVVRGFHVEHVAG